MTEVDVDSTLGVLYDGALASAIFYGVASGQFFRYCTTYYEDGLALKCTVFIVWLVSSVQQCMLVRMVWQHVIPPIALKWGQDHPNWSTMTQLISAEIVTLFIECFFVYRIWSSTHLKKTALLPLLPAICAFSFRITHIVKHVGHPLLMHAAKQGVLFSREMPHMAANDQQWFVVAYAILRIITDLTIVVWMIWLLAHEKRAECTPRPHRQLRIGRIFDYLFATGLVNSVITVTYLVLYFAVPANAYNVLYLMHGKLYFNSMLASLNSRDPPRERSEVAFITTSDFS